MLIRYIVSTMPSKFVLKEYKTGSHYHIFNRGVNEMRIFSSEDDYVEFLGYLEQYLSLPPDPENLRREVSFKGVSFKGIPRQPKNFATSIDLEAFVLMPNHFHLLIKQNEEKAMETFMRALATRYATYFNKTHGRRGYFFEGPYKAVEIAGPDRLLHMTRFIHRKPAKYLDDLTKAYSSYGDYVDLTNKRTWLKNSEILSILKENPFPDQEFSTYEQFVREYRGDAKAILSDIVIDEENEGYYES